MNSKFLRHIAGLLAAAVLLQFYFVREILVMEILFALFLIVALVVAGAGYLIGCAMLLWLERLRSSPAELRSIEP
jgi:hypothetical protein